MSAAYGRSQTTPVYFGVKFDPTGDNFRMVGNPEAIAEIKPLRDQNGTFGIDVEIKKRF